MPAAATYRRFQADLPCGRVYVGEGPRRPRNGDRYAMKDVETVVRVACDCGTQHTVVVDPILMVVGYRGSAMS